MALDLKSLSARELRSLIADANRHVAEAQEKEVRETRSKIDALLAKAGLTLEEVYPVAGTPRAKRSGKLTKAALAPKYQNPADASQQWSGRGRPPAWFAAALKKRGVTADHLLVEGGAKLAALEKASIASRRNREGRSTRPAAKPTRKVTSGKKR